MVNVIALQFCETVAGHNSQELSSLHRNAWRISTLTETTDEGAGFVNPSWTLLTLWYFTKIVQVLTKWSSADTVLTATRRLRHNQMFNGAPCQQLLAANLNMIKGYAGKELTKRIINRPQTTRILLTTDLRKSSYTEPVHIKFLYIYLSSAIGIILQAYHMILDHVPSKTWDKTALRGLLLRTTSVLHKGISSVFGAESLSSTLF